MKSNDTEEMPIMGESGTSLSLLVGEDVDSNEDSPDNGAPKVLEGEELQAWIGTKGTTTVRGRPPRAPFALERDTSDTLIEHTTNKPKHKHTSSIGDNSFISNLTFDGQNERPSSIKRGISWDAAVAKELKEKAPDPVLVGGPPSLIHAMDSAQAPPAESSTPPPPPRRSSVKPVSKWAKVRAATLKVDDVRMTNPLESEAEGAILRLLEKTRRCSIQESSNILPHVTEPAVDAFQPDPSKSGGDLSSGDLAQSKTTDDASDKTEQTKPGSPRHKRKPTLDNTLFDLGAEMQRIQKKHDTSIEEGDKEEEPDILGDKVPTSDTDTLVKNAALLFRRSVSKNKTPSETETLEASPPKTDKSPWSLFQANEALAKKKDDGGLDITEDKNEIDIESGVAEVDDRARPDSIAMKAKKTGFRNAKSTFRRAKEEAKEDLGYFNMFLQPRKSTIKLYLKIWTLAVFIPLTSIAAALFYAPDQPVLFREGATFSWFILYLLRQTITFSMAKTAELFIIDFLSLQARVTVRIFGPIFTLVLVQAKGYPFKMFMWGFFNFCLLSGSHAFPKHWLFWQDKILMLSEANTAGNITESSFNYAINGTAMGVGVVVALKRFWWGLYIGKRSYLHYGDELASVIKNMLLVSKVAGLSKDLEKKKARGLTFLNQIDSFPSFRVDSYDIDGSLASDSGGDPSSPLGDAKGMVIDEERKCKFTETLSQSQKVRLTEMLGEWEEPETVHDAENADVSITSILQFRQTLAFMDQEYPFSLAYGPADTREDCVKSAQNVYTRLMIRTPDLDKLPFETISILAMDKDGVIDRDKMKSLIRLFRPDRDGSLSLLDFVKSCDTVYKSIRMLRASIVNSGQVDHAFETLVNVAFFVVLGCIVIWLLGFDPLALFLSLSSVIVGFAFMIGSASSKYFEGILFVLVRRPYDIGDRIATSDVNSISSSDGSATWFVQNVDLFTTTIRYAATNEVATVSNGSLAASRVINAKRSPKATCFVYMKFGVSVQYHKIQVFRKALESFVKERPREWLALNGFRATQVAAEQGYVEYVIILSHRESWQNIGAILQSKADVASYCLEVSKKLDMKYTAPALPVNLSLLGLESEQQQQKSDIGSLNMDSIPDMDTGSQSSTSPDVRSIAALFKRPVGK